MSNVNFDAPAHLESTKMISAFVLIGKENAKQLAQNFLQQTCMAYISFVWLVVGLEIQKYQNSPEELNFPSVFDRIPTILGQDFSLQGQNWHYTLVFSLKIADLIKHCANWPNFSSANDENVLFDALRHDVWQGALNAASSLLNNCDGEQAPSELSEEFVTNGITIGYKLNVARLS